MHVLIYGATSRIAHECARVWVRQGARLLLCGRDPQRLEEVAADLRARAADPALVAVRVVDTASDADLRAGLQAAQDGFAPDVALVAHGWLPEQAAAQGDAALLRQCVEVNALSVAQACEALAAGFEARGRGTLAVIGSVAGDRGRQSNYIYGAAKGFVERYCQGLRQRLHPRGVRVVLVKPGPTDTPMTRGMVPAPGSRRPPLADPAQVARAMVAGIAAGRTVVYVPGRWRLVMAVIRAIPERLFVRLKL